MKIYTALAMVSLIMYSSPTLADNSLTIYVYPPNNPINWSTPKSTVNSFVRNMRNSLLSSNSYPIRGRNDQGEHYSINSTYQSTMGHTITHVDCTRSDNTRYNKWSSFTGLNSFKDSKNVSIRTQLGFGALFYDFDDGSLITGSENIHRLIYITGRRVNSANASSVIREKPYFMRIPNITTNQCEQIRHMVYFFENYNRFKVNIEAGRKLLFSNNYDPYESYRAFFANDNQGPAGGGCAPYGVAFLKLLGLWNKSLENLTSLNVSVGEHLIGDGQSKKISINDIRNGSLGNVWVRSTERFRHFFQYDPRLIWQMIGRLRACRGTRDYQSMSCTPSTQRLLNQEFVGGKLPAPQLFRDTQRVRDNYDRELTRTIKKEVVIPGIILNN